MMQDKRFQNFLLAIATMALVTCAGSCGSGPETTEVTGPDPMPRAIQPVEHPSLEGLEPFARQLVQGQKERLDSLLQTNTTDTAERGKAYGRMGMLYFAFRYKSPAEICFLNAVFSNSDNFRWSYYLGRLYTDAHEPAKAAYFLEKAHALDPANLPAMVALAQSLRENDQPARAREVFERVLAADPQNAPAHMGLGQIEASEKNYREAVNRFQTVLQLQPRASAVHYPLALAYRGLNDLENAEKFMAARGDVEPRMADLFMDAINQPRANAHYRMAETLRLAGKIDDALPHYELVVQLDPTNPRPRMGRELALIRAGRYVGAVIALHEDLADFPQLAVFHHMLARIFAASPDDRVRDAPKALAILRQLTKGEVSPEMTETLAMAFAEAGNFEDAVRAQQKAIELANKAGDEDLAKLMADNLALYNQQKPCRTPWRDNDPIFTRVTYGQQ